MLWNDCLEYGIFVFSLCCFEGGRTHSCIQETLKFIPSVADQFVLLFQIILLSLSLSSSTRATGTLFLEYEYKILEG